MEYWASKADEILFLFCAMCCAFKNQISLHQTQYADTPLLQPVPPKSLPRRDEGGYSMTLQAGFTAQPISSELARGSHLQY